jgi:hypothetical protein
MSLSEDGFGAELAYLLTSDVRTHGEEDLSLTSTSGNLKLDGTAVEMTGDLIINSNLIVNNSVNFQDMNIFRKFDDGHTISYGMRINDMERLEIFKFDSRVGKSTVVNTFGMGGVSTTNTTLNETISQNLDTVYNRGKYVTKPTRPIQSQSPD